MNALWGADTDALRTLGAVCARRSELLADLESRLSATLDGVCWIGEDAERFRADWAGRVRPGLLDRSVELRHHARRLQQHADEQEAASSPGGLGGGWSDSGTSPQVVARRARETIGDPRGTVGGRAAFPGSFLGSFRGGISALIGEGTEPGPAGGSGAGDVLAPGAGSAARIGGDIGRAGADGAPR